MNNGRKSQYTELDSNHSVSTNMNGQEAADGMFARGVGFEEQSTQAPRRGTMFGTLKEAVGGRMSTHEGRDDL
ncbi:hypothetical protein GGF47_004106, partial [Coemansia sp. RSA 2524]